MYIQKIYDIVFIHLLFVPERKNTTYVLFPSLRLLYIDMLYVVIIVVIKLYIYYNYYYYNHERKRKRIDHTRNTIPKRQLLQRQQGGGGGLCVYDEEDRGRYDHIIMWY